MKVVSIVGYKNTGKTDIVTKITRKLIKKGSVGTIKHMRSHDFIDPDTDTGKHFAAGAEIVSGIVNSGVITYTKSSSLEDSLNILADNGIDFAIVEGGKETDLPKIIIENGSVLPNLTNVVAKISLDEEQEIEYLIEIISSLPDWETLGSLIKKAKSNPDIKESGAIGTFTGIVREQTGNLKTRMLVFEKYEYVAEQKIQDICNSLKQKEGINEVLIHHKSGMIKPGQDIVYIVIAASHRHQLFPALSEAIERLKAEVPVWKKEFTFDGEYWVHDK